MSSVRGMLHGREQEHAEDSGRSMVSIGRALIRAGLSSTALVVVISASGCVSATTCTTELNYNSIEVSLAGDTSAVDHIEICDDQGICAPDSRQLEECATTSSSCFASGPDEYSSPYGYIWNGSQSGPTWRMSISERPREVEIRVLDRDGQTISSFDIEPEWKDRDRPGSCTPGASAAVAFNL